MPKYPVSFWKQAPFVRLLIPIITGILLQWYLQLPVELFFVLLGTAILILSSFFFVSERFKFSYGWLQGIALHTTFVVAGCALTYIQDIRHNKDWIGKHYSDSSALLVTIREPLVEKTKSYKAIASLEALQKDGSWIPVEGRMLIYFRKEDVIPSVGYGSQIIFTKPLQEIKNSGNPGAFNYQRYSAFQDIYHQVFLGQHEYFLTSQTDANVVWSKLFNTRKWVIETLRKYIKPEREAGVAEALLIGYRDDLDKDLVQAYSNTGVVHIIAISGLHLGLIYGILVGVFQRFKKRKGINWVKPITILVVLWTFTLVAGAAPSILRSAVMFTALVLGDVIDRKTSVYNNLAASAFIMLCYNPFFLWDVGFQLSYAALVSIVTFRDPIYKLIYIENKGLDRFWRLNAVTISAQILTLPLVLYHFHQFPDLFLLANLVAVPLSGFILYAELGLLGVSLVPYLAVWVGKICSGMIWSLNYFVEAINNLPFAVSDNIQLSVVQALLITAIIASLSYWLIQKNKRGFLIGMLLSFVFLATIVTDKYYRSRQKKIIVYNIPQHTALDFIDADNFYFVGDTSILTDHFTQNFHLKPSRILHQVKASSLREFYFTHPFAQFKNKRVLLIDKPFKFQTTNKIPVDLIVISKNPRVYIKELLEAFDCKQFVFDASNPAWKINLWKKDCDSLHLRHHSTAEQGAFEMNL